MSMFSLSNVQHERSVMSDRAHTVRRHWNQNSCVALHGPFKKSTLKF